MPLVATAKSSGQDIPPMDAGMYPAVCVSIIDLGTQTSKFEGQEKSAHKVLVSWEIPSEKYTIETDEGPVEKSRVISNRYTLSMHEKATLRKTIGAWRGKALTDAEANNYDVQGLLGKPCTLTISHSEAKGGSGKTYANVQAVAPLMKGTPAPKPTNELQFYSIADHGRNTPAGLSPKLVETIAKSPEYQAAKGELEPPASSIPF